MKPLLIISDLDNSDESTSGTDRDTEEWIYNYLIFVTWEWFVT